jgi:hypothetical protein
MLLNHEPVFARATDATALGLGGLFKISFSDVFFERHEHAASSASSPATPPSLASFTKFVNCSRLDHCNPRAPSVPLRKIPESRPHQKKK